MSKVVKEAVAAAKARATEAQKQNDAAAKSGGFKPSPLGDGVIEKFLRDEIQARQAELVEEAVAEAEGSFAAGATK